MSINDVTGFLSWPPSQFKDPISIEHGIRLQKPISELAQHWWSKKWLAIIEEFGMGVRLERARMYATRGQIASIDIDNGIVKATVQGSETDPYRVTIAVKTIPKAVWTSILRDLAVDSRFGIGLASQTLPPQEDIEGAFHNNGALLFPDRQGELQTKCSCPDWSNPCKHVAAVYLLLAAEFDRDPYLIFKLRGLCMSDLFSMLPGSPACAPDGSAVLPPAGQAQPVTKHLATAAPVEAEPVVSNSKPAGASTFDARKFFRCTVKAADVLGEWQPASQAGALAESLGEFPFWQGQDNLLIAIRSACQNATFQALQLLDSASAKRSIM